MWSNTGDLAYCSCLKGSQPSTHCSGSSHQECNTHAHTQTPENHSPFNSPPQHTKNTHTHTHTLHPHSYFIPALCTCPSFVLTANMCCTLFVFFAMYLNITHCLPWTFVQTNLSKQKDGKGIKVSKANCPSTPPPTHTYPVPRRGWPCTCKIPLPQEKSWKWGQSVCLLLVLYSEMTYCTTCEMYSPNRGITIAMTTHSKKQNAGHGMISIHDSFIYFE